MKNIRFLLWIPIAVITMAMLSCSDKAEQIIIDPNAEEQIEPLTVTPFDIKKRGERLPLAGCQLEAGR